MKINNKALNYRTYDQALFNELIGGGVQPVLARIYAARNTRPTSWLDKQILKKDTLVNALEAGKLIGDHIIKGDKGCVHSDFDNDGIGSAAIVVKAIRSFGGEIINLCPSRILEGYGSNVNMVRKAFDLGCKYIISVDNGIVQFEAIAEAKRLGLTYICTDHHLPDKSGKLPIADVIVNPWAEFGAQQFGSKNLCGAGVAWYVMAALRDYLKSQNWGKDFNMRSVVDLVGVATIADMVPLCSNNRKIVKMGIDKLNSEQINRGLSALLYVSGKNNSMVNSTTIGFTLAPLINSIGRLESADAGVELLCAENDETALNIAKELKTTNEERKLIQKEITEFAMDNLNLSEMDYCCVVYNPELHEGVVGLACNKVKDAINKPTAVLTDAHDKDRIKGSFRSIKGVHMRDVLDLTGKKDPSIGLRAGGHGMAAGGQFYKDKLEAFKVAFNEAVKEMADKEAFSPTLDVDGVITDKDITFELVEAINEESWGQGMPAPNFFAEVTLSGQKILKDAHCKFTAKIGRMELDGIFFGRDFFMPEKVGMVFSLDINEWMGNRKIQILCQGINDDDEGLFR